MGGGARIETSRRRCLTAAGAVGQRGYFLWLTRRCDDDELARLAGQLPGDLSAGPDTLVGIDRGFDHEAVAVLIDEVVAAGPQ